MLSVQEIADRMEIQQLMIEYSSAIDQHDFDRLDDVFTPDAYIDYRAMGGMDGRYPEVKAWLKPALGAFPHYQHMIGNMSIKVTGDTATGRTICFNPMEVKLADGKTQVMFLGLWYLDKFVRTTKGWRISERVEEASYAHNVPANIRVTEK
jgi:ketosteroid isomerase-like protein